MGRLVTSVREAEERLAGIARALQSAYDEELREALEARDAAARGLVRAQAMEEASRALGHDDVTARVAEVIQQLQASHKTAVDRLAELARIEKTVQNRLTDGESATPSAPRLPAAPPASSTSSVAVTPPAEDPLAANETQLLSRIDEVEKLVPKWPKDLAQVTVQEHVALVRLLIDRFTAAQRPAPALTMAIERLCAVTDTLNLLDIVGLGEEKLVWSKVANEARGKRLALADARKRTLTRPS